MKGEERRIDTIRRGEEDARGEGGWKKRRRDEMRRGE